MKLENKLNNINYLCKIVRLPELRPHPNADKLSLVTIENQIIITGKENKKSNELFCYFPLECKINSDFLSFINGYSNPEYNRDKTLKGFFSYPKNRVKALRLRGIVSEGYLHPVSEINDWLKTQRIKYQVTDEDLNKEFDSIGDILFVEKYIPASQKLPLGPNNPKCRVKRESRLIDNQFRLSPDYRQLKREIHNINPDDWIEITSKWHGANGVVAKVLTKRNLSMVDKIAKFFGAQIDDREYNLVFSSRRVVKSEEFRDGPARDFYGDNIWATVAYKYKDSLQNGISLVGEVVGFTSNGSPIQKSKKGPYDYGCAATTCDFIVFRITYTSADGHVYEFSLQQVIDYCQKYGLKNVPVYYIGRAKDLYPELDVRNHWHENFLNKLTENYLEKDCVYCKTSGLPDEGIVLSKRVGGFVGLKLKSQKFLLSESEQLDTEEISVEDQEDIINEL
jgi:hypothetical protein